MKALLILILSVLLTGCITPAEHEALQKKLYAAQEQIEERDKRIKFLESAELQKAWIRQENENKARAYLMCSFPVDFCPVSVKDAGQKAIAAGASGGTSFEIWGVRSVVAMSLFLIIFPGLYLCELIRIKLISPSKAEIEIHKRLVADQEKIINDAKTQEKKLLENAKEERAELQKVQGQIAKTRADLAAVQQSKNEIEQQKAQLQDDIKKMEMIRNAMRSSS